MPLWMPGYPYMPVGYPPVPMMPPGMYGTVGMQAQLGQQLPMVPGMNKGAAMKAQGRQSDSKERRRRGGKKKKDDGGGGSAAPTSSFQPLVLVPVVEEWVTLDLKLLNWNYMNFHHRCKTSTRLFQVKKILADKHGRIKDLKICKEQFAERNEMGDEMATLASYGIKGAPQEAPHVVYTLHYDFTQIGRAHV